MKLTPDQREQVCRAKAAGAQRVSLDFTPEQREQWQAAVQQELAGKDENLAHVRKVKAAAECAGFFGDLRRAMAASRQSTDELADEIGITPQLLSDFRAGEAELPAMALDRLIEALGLRLMREIAR
jgi:DNA-binding Xre family transcriptional regulator